MRIGNLVLRMRKKNTSFGTLVGGAAELEVAMMNTLTKNMAFIIPVSESAEGNGYDSIVDQKLIERFAVVIALQTDSDMKEKLGHKAYDKIHDIRNELFGVFAGIQLQEAESLIYYRGGRLLDMTRAYLWYQFEFEYESRMSLCESGIYGILETDVDDEEVPVDFDEIRAAILIAPSVDLPYKGNLPNTNYPNWIVNFGNNPSFGSFGKMFGSGWNVNKL